MKKILIVPIVLVLIIFSLYHEDVDGMPTTKEGHTKVTQEIEIIEEIIEEVQIEKEKKHDKEVFSVEIKGELNTTKETPLRLRAEVHNAHDSDKCNYWWYKNKKLVSIGNVLEETFTKGEHQVHLVVRDANGIEANSTVVVGAYDYYSVQRFNYDPHYGNLLYVEKQILNHKGQYVLYDDGLHTKEYLEYNEASNLIEQTLEFHHQPNKNTKTVYSYDNIGNRLTSQSFNSEGESVYYRVNTYDENRTVISSKVGKNEENLVDEYATGNQIVYYADPYATIEQEQNIPNDIIRTNDKGQIIYEERYYYGGYKNINEMSYDEHDKLIKSVRKATSEYDSRLDITDYDKDGNAIKVEVRSEVMNQGLCHYISQRTYTSMGQTESEVSRLVDGECPYVDEVKRNYVYDDKGNIINIKVLSDEDSNVGFNTLKVVKAYTNEIEM
ncbi:MAG: Unknown protein [uncultured Sulfurovum sp.]|uniref:Uncharacterized protein n=1 Tax=uncultured Sulfurovum sp. TaxID=269237 RepID=A0A6S6TQ58_9BACT|nr:MAG: Unknown protein [uncultured Sulfurovum sp.]